MKNSNNIYVKDVTQRIFENLTELQSAVGEELGITDWLVIDQERMNCFAEVTGDHQWIHVDPEKSKAGPFGGTIASGYLTLSLIPHWVEQTFKVRGISGVLSYGLNKVRFTSPVPVGSRLCASITLSAFDDVPGGGQVTLTVIVKAEGQSKPVCVATVLMRFFI